MVANGRIRNRIFRKVSVRSSAVDIVDAVENGVLTAILP
jgi:hypothetical protein